MNVETQPAAPVADLRWLAHFINRHRGAAIGSLVTGAVGGVTTALEPYLIGVIIDSLRQGATIELIINQIILLMGLAIVTVIAFYGQRVYSGTIAYEVIFDIRKAVFDNLLTLDQGFYQRYATGDLISRMDSDVQMVWRLLALGFVRFGSAIVGFLLTFALLASVNLLLTVVVFIVLAISTAFQIQSGIVLAPIFERVQEQAGTISALVQDSASGIQTIKNFGKEEGVGRKFYDENLEFKRRWLYFKRRNEPVGMLPNMISQLTAGIVVLFGGIMTVNGAITLGNFVQFLIYLGFISTVLLQLGTIYQRYQQTRGALARITPLLQHATIRSKENAEPLSQPRGEIRFENVGINIDGNWLLRNISFHIPAGSVVAFVGPTGCGKSLLVSLLARVIDPDEGRVLIDGIDVRDLKLEELREAIAYVPQSTFLFSRTLTENVKMGKDAITEEEIQRAIHISRVSNDLPQLPNGTETLVGERGVMLSGGQKQRVAIARAVARDPAILVLDDALSSVDTHTAAEILGDLRGVLESRTSIIIAHRIATVKDAETIFVMNSGSIIEFGDHHSLIIKGGAYSRMVERELIEEKMAHAEE